MEKALELNPDNPDFYWLLGDQYVKAKRYSDAISVVRRELEIRPNSAAAYCIWGKALEKQGDFEGAISRFERAVECNDPAWHDYALKEIERQQKLIERRELMKEQEELDDE
jgi:tetratricopeptide (TPR) repeat protein